MNLLHTFGTLLCGTAALFAWLFVALYARKPWRRWEEGRHLMVFTGGLAVILTYVTVRTSTSSQPVAPAGVEAVRFVSFAFLALMLVWRFTLLWRATREDHPNAFPERARSDD